MLRKSLTYLQKQAFCNKHYGPYFDIKIEVPETYECSKEYLYVKTYREQGHHVSKLDPLAIFKNENPFPLAIDFGLHYQNNIDILLEQERFAHFRKYNLSTVEDLEHYLQKAYTSSAGVEFSHIQDPKEKEWLYTQFEDCQLAKLTSSEKSNIHSTMIQTEAFDHFLQKKFNTFKRYSGEGIESQIVFLKKLLATASEQDIQSCVIGTAHRGRMNILVNVLDYPARDLFYKISGKGFIPEELYNFTDDVPHHISTSNEVTIRMGSGKEKPISLTMVHNPSHLEAVNPVAMGKTRAKQASHKDQRDVLNVQLHGDAAFCGQGVVYESFAISKVPHFQIAGTVHINVNNQIGYTTSPQDQRPNKYSTEICKAFDVPVVHVNSEDVESVYKVAKFALEYRQKFKKDIMIDIIGYRRYGHNELDEPGFTQPLMYNQIRKNQTTCPQKYHQTLVEKGLAKEESLKNIQTKTFDFLEKQFQESKTYVPTMEDFTTSKKGNKALTKQWSSMTFSALSKQGEILTGIPESQIQAFGESSVHHPSDFTVHDRLKKFHIDERLKQLSNKKVDWATAESIAFQSLVREGYDIRLSGQDVERGTFSQRHCVLTDQKDESKYHILNEGTQPGSFNACNSPLSELAVLGFEYGYSMENPNNLVIWEAQFGDFFNTAQVMYDVFITNSEAKWLRQSSLMCFLPHGYDGAGPEHSSSRIERFLQLASTDGICKNFTQELGNERKQLQVEDKHFYGDHKDVNFSLVQPTTPANMFHLIRRQMLRDYRKPIIVANAKTLLRLPAARSSFADFSEGTQFEPLLQYGEGKEIVILCSGKISYDIKSLIADKSNVRVLVLEELLPFPEAILKQRLQEVQKDAKVIWAQDEPVNCGAYSFAIPHVQRILSQLKIEKEVVYCGRRAIAQTATGDSTQHKKENSQIQAYLKKLIN